MYEEGTTNDFFCFYTYTFMYVHLCKMQTSETVLFDCPQTDKTYEVSGLSDHLKLVIVVMQIFDVHSNIM